MQRIQVLARHSDAKVKALAELVRDIARVKPRERRRVRAIADKHWTLFVRMVAILPDAYWGESFLGYGEQSEWLWERYEKAKVEAHRLRHGSLPCWCGSQRAYWDCCACRDEMFAEQFANEEQERECQSFAGRRRWKGLFHEWRRQLRRC